MYLHDFSTIFAIGFCEASLAARLRNHRVTAASSDQSAAVFQATSMFPIWKTL
jgi:hypothetical protein